MLVYQQSVETSDRVAKDPFLGPVREGHRRPSKTSLELNSVEFFFLLRRLDLRRTRQGQSALGADRYSCGLRVDAGDNKQKRK